MADKEQARNGANPSNLFYQYLALLTAEYDHLVQENAKLRASNATHPKAAELNGTLKWQPTKSTICSYSASQITSQESYQTSQATSAPAEHTGSSFMNICWSADSGTVPTPVDAMAVSDVRETEGIGSSFRRQPALVLAVPHEAGGTPTSCYSRPSRAPSEALQNQVFRTSADIKAVIRAQISNENAQCKDEEFYHTTGCAQHMARSMVFERMSMSLIAVYAIWLGIDTDFNEEVVNTNPASVFFWGEQVFCTFFTAELLIRFLAVKTKRKCFKDFWFVFDAFLVGTMVIQTWLVPVVQLMIQQSGSASVAGNASVLRIARLLRLTRLLRMARLLRFMPELFILVKAIIAAMRSVVFTLALLMMLLYAFSIAFTQSLKGTECGSAYFSNVLLSMQSFFIFGTLLDEVWDLVSAMVNEKLWLALTGLYFFIIFSAVTIMNMLIGVMCEVITAVAAAEKESLQVSWVKDTLQRVMGGSDVYVDQQEFYQILRDQEVAKALSDVGVDIMSLLDFADLIFEERGVSGDCDPESQEHRLSFGDFVEQVLQLQKSNTATVKDMVNLRWWISQSLQTKIEATMEKVMADHFGSPNKKRMSSCVSLPAYRRPTI